MHIDRHVARLLCLVECPVWSDACLIKLVCETNLGQSLLLGLITGRDSESSVCQRSRKYKLGVEGNLAQLVPSGPQRDPPVASCHLS